MNAEDAMDKQDLEHKMYLLEKQIDVLAQRIGGLKRTSRKMRDIREGEFTTERNLKIDEYNALYDQYAKIIKRYSAPVPA